MKNKSLDILFGQKILTLNNYNLLIVGVGGIGTQLLKAVIHLPFKHIHIIDLDTIEVTSPHKISNLNRQFLFRKQHQGLSKAKVAKDAILKINPDINITAHQCNIKQKQINFFKQFNLIVLALDNIQSRIYVNHIAMRLNIPIIDAGTSGFLGQVLILKKGITQCYSCTQKSTKEQKTYPACTIRNRPQKPIHCVIWAKYLFQILFGVQNEQNLLVDLRKKMQWQQVDINQGKTLFNELFFEQVMRTNGEQVRKKYNIKGLKEDQIPDIQSIQQGDSYMNSTHSIEVYKYMFLKYLIQLSLRKKKQQIIVFHKDDEDIIHFITASANLRALLFNITLQNFFEVKEMAASIIPAIASTNSMVSGIQILEALKEFSITQAQRKDIFVQNVKQKKVLAKKPQKPNNECFCCSIKHQPIIMQCDLQKITLGELNKIIIERCGWLKQYSISQGSIDILSQRQDLDQEQIQQNATKCQSKLSNYFNTNFNKLSVIDQSDGCIAFFILLLQSSQSAFIQINNPQLFMIRQNEYKQKNSNKDGDKQGQSKQCDKQIIEQQVCMQMQICKKPPTAQVGQRIIKFQ